MPSNSHTCKDAIITVACFPRVLMRVVWVGESEAVVNPHSTSGVIPYSADPRNTAPVVCMCAWLGHDFGTTLVAIVLIVCMCP